VHHPDTKAVLIQIVRSPSRPQAPVERRIILAAAAGECNQEIAADLNLPKVTVGKWRRPFATMGLEGLQDAR
jgi:hypothetical protein